MEERINGRYKIIESVSVNHNDIVEYVLGAKETEWGVDYVTWAYADDSYFWGHYFDLDDLLSARIDLLKRALRELNNQYDIREANKNAN